MPPKIPDMPDFVQKFVEDLIKQLHSTETAPLKDWLFAMGSMTAILMKTAGLDEKQARDAMSYVATVSYNVYHNLPSEEAGLVQ